MVIEKSIEDLINYRIQEEEKSSRLYFYMSKWLAFNGFSGASKLWDKYSSEELNHASWAYSYLEDLNILPCVDSIEKPDVEISSLQDVINKSLEHEILITKQCNDLAKAALAANDFMTLELAQKYLKEQVEEIAKTTYWVDRLSAFGDEPAALRLLDDEMGSI